MAAVAVGPASEARTNSRTPVVAVEAEDVSLSVVVAVAAVTAAAATSLWAEIEAQKER